MSLIRNKRKDNNLSVHRYKRSLYSLIYTGKPNKILNFSNDQMKKSILIFLLLLKINNLNILSKKSNNFNIPIHINRCLYYISIHKYIIEK
jgi:hypothetical protein